MPERIADSDPEGVDYGWVMQVTFVLTIVVGVPVVAGLSTLSSLPTWSDRASFAVSVGASVWVVMGLLVLGYAKWVRA